jgi:hypothetical protein
MAFNKVDRISNAQSYGPKSPSKIKLYVNENKTPEDNKPSLYGYATDKDMMLSSVSVWKNKTKKGKVIFSGNKEALGVKQNVVDMPKKEPEQKDNLDDILS